MYVLWTRSDFLGVVEHHYFGMGRNNLRNSYRCHLRLTFNRAIIRSAHFENRVYFGEITHMNSARAQGRCGSAWICFKEAKGNVAVFYA
jgi:hypothetical protein